MKKLVVQAHPVIIKSEDTQSGICIYEARGILINIYFKKEGPTASPSTRPSGICQRECRNNSLHYTRATLIIVIYDSSINGKSRI